MSDVRFVDSGQFKKRDDSTCCDQAVRLELVVFGPNGSGGLVKDMADVKEIIQKAAGMWKLAGIIWSVLGASGVVAVLKWISMKP